MSIQFVLMIIVYISILVLIYVRLSFVFAIFG